MTGDTQYINSSAVDTKVNQIKYRYLADINGVVVGKVFINQKLIVFDDQEIVAALDNRSNRRYTLPIPRISAVPVDSKCDVQGDITNPLLPPDKTVFVTYLLSYTGGTGLTGMHCNYYGKVDYSGVNSDVSMTFGSDTFQYMTTDPTNTTGYVADKFYILAQQVNTGDKPVSWDWTLMDYTDEFTLTGGGFINPEDLRGTRFIISHQDLEDGDKYNLEATLNYPTILGNEQPFPGEIDVVRGYDIEVMKYTIKLPPGYFDTTQNPSWINHPDPKPPLRITEAALLDGNKDVLVIGKTSSPLLRGTNSPFVIQIDL